MKILLVGGAQSVGKSETIYRLTLELISKGFVDIHGLVPPHFADFKAILVGIDKNGKEIRILINTATDTPGHINRMFDFLKVNGKIDILISSVRDDNFYPRNEFFKITGINPTNKNLIEIPLAKITRRGTNFVVALKWYSEKIDQLIIHTLANNPFSI